MVSGGAHMIILAFPEGEIDELSELLGPSRFVNEYMDKSIEALFPDARCPMERILKILNPSSPDP